MIHHITAIARDPRANIHFYQHILGQRLVKKTVNFDDSGTYHFYYGDQIGTPGTVLTFFPWPGVHRGIRGSGETQAIAYAIRPESLSFWRDYLAQNQIKVEDKGKRFGDSVLAFEDPDGMPLELIATPAAADISVWTNGPIPAEHVLQGFHGVTLGLDQTGATADLLTHPMSYTFVGQEGNRQRFRSEGNRAIFVDLLNLPNEIPGKLGAGSVHHVAFRASDDAEQIRFHRDLSRAGQQVTQVRDRQYFHSIYFREPGGVLFEIATDTPGFLIDEPIDTLGTHLKLPPWLEDHRDDIEAALPALEDAHV